MKSILAAIGLSSLIMGGLVQAAELSGRLDWSQRLPMGLMVSGVVAQVPAKIGQRVKTGDLLLALDQRGFQAEVDKADAQVEYTEALWEEAKREEARAMELYDRTVLSEHERTQTHIALKQALATYQAARSNQIQARLRQQYRVLEAPFDGVVVKLDAVVGQSVVNTQQSQTLLVLADDDPMHFTGYVDLGTAKAIQRAAPVAVLIEGERFNVVNVQFSPEPAKQSAKGPLYRLAAAFHQPDDFILQAGQPASLVW